jgi:hypothetical protein
MLVGHIPSHSGRDSITYGLCAPRTLHPSCLLGSTCKHEQNRAGSHLLSIMPAAPGKKLGQKIDIDFTLRKVFGRDSFRYARGMAAREALSCIPTLIHRHPT